MEKENQDVKFIALDYKRYLDLKRKEQLSERAMLDIIAYLDKRNQVDVAYCSSKSIINPIVEYIEKQYSNIFKKEIL